MISKINSENSSTCVGLPPPSPEATQSPRLSTYNNRQTSRGLISCPHQQKQRNKMAPQEGSTDDTISMIPFYIAITLVPLGVIVAVGLMLYAGPASLRHLRENNRHVISRLGDINLDTMNSRPRPQRLSIAPWMIDEDLAVLGGSSQYRAIPPVPTSSRPIHLPQPATTPPGQHQRDEMEDREEKSPFAASLQVPLRSARAVRDLCDLRENPPQDLEQTTPLRTLLRQSNRRRHCQHRNIRDLARMATAVSWTRAGQLVHEMVR